MILSHRAGRLRRVWCVSGLHWWYTPRGEVKRIRARAETRGWFEPPRCRRCEEMDDAVRARLTRDWREAVNELNFERGTRKQREARIEGLLEEVDRLKAIALQAMLEAGAWERAYLSVQRDVAATETPRPKPGQ